MYWNDEICSKNDELCSKNHEFCIQNEGSCVVTGHELDHEVAQPPQWFSLQNSLLLMQNSSILDRAILVFDTKPLVLNAKFKSFAHNHGRPPTKSIIFDAKFIIFNAKISILPAISTKNRSKQENQRKPNVDQSSAGMYYIQSTQYHRTINRKFNSKW